MFGVLLRSLQLYSDTYGLWYVVPGSDSEVCPVNQFNSDVSLQMDKRETCNKNWYLILKPDVNCA